MRCEQFEQRLQRCLDRRLEPSGDPTLRRHADVCPRCRSTLAAYTRLADGLDLLELPVPAESFSQQVVEHVRVQRRSPAARSRLGATIFAVAASLLAAWLPQFVARDASLPPVSRRSPAQDAALAADAKAPASPRARTLARATDVPAGTTAEGRVSLVPWTNWPADWPFQTWDPIDRLAGGLTPITAPLGVAVQEIRRTIPLGRIEQPAAPSGDSIRQSSRRHACPVV